jgi:glutamate synthase domain-containing protein 3
VTAAEAERVRELVELHATSTRSARAAALLYRWDETVALLRRVLPSVQAVDLARAGEESG